MPTVSVIVPNYNHARFLPEAHRERFCAQTYQDFELILLDDCSTDDSRDDSFAIRERSSRAPRIQPGQFGQHIQAME